MKNHCRQYKCTHPPLRTHTLMRVHTHARTHTHIRTRAHAHTHTHTHTHHTHTHTHTHARARARTQAIGTHARTHTQSVNTPSIQATPLLDASMLSVSLSVNNTEPVSACSERERERERDAAHRDWRGALRRGVCQWPDTTCMHGINCRAIVWQQGLAV